MNEPGAAPAETGPPFRLEPVSGWGRLPVRPGRVARPERLGLPPEGHVLPRGLGRAYGDAAVPAAAGDLVLETTRADRIIAFDATTGLLTAEAGLSLAEVMRLFLPRGWFPPVTPGTSFVTLGGAVAADVHGKNHHREGSFGRYVDSIRLLAGDGRAVRASLRDERELFLASVGGMGLTGLITEVAFRLRPVESAWVHVETEAAGTLAETATALRATGSAWPYTVAWIDGLAKGDALGRGVILRGRHATAVEAAGRALAAPRRLRVPIDAPSWLLSAPVVRGLNRLYHRGRSADPRRRLVPYHAFFHPLDGVLDWNRLYGRRGFLQYQCVVPAAAGLDPLALVLTRIARAGAASFLAVLKDCGPASAAYLSFPLEGLTLSLDLPYRGGATEALVHELNAIVIEAGGRVYLAKDALTRAPDFARMAPALDAWQRVRDRWDPRRRFRSALSVRLLGDPA
ncbi:MAG: FAD-binding oxidoreductase [Candidatus Rokubacteria bacterium]|nr:FAD-binding oxidoreductase [Candidatus Rokubacteria bacterium]